MKAFCAWCQAEGGEGFLGVREPLDDPTETHAICQRHHDAELALLTIREGRESGQLPERLDQFAAKLGGWLSARHGRMRVYAFCRLEHALLFAGDWRGMLIKGGNGECYPPVPPRVAVLEALRA